jgi:hypothetical protein
MTAADRIDLLKRAIKERNDASGKGGQAAVARELGYSASTINQILKGVYPTPDPVLQKVFEVYGGQVVRCPSLGDIPLSRCVDEHSKPLRITSAHAVRQYRACRACNRRK